MTLDAARASIVAAVEGAKAGCPGGVPIIEYDNRIIVDTTTASAPFLQVEIHYMDGEQADLSSAPRHRYWGQIHLKVGVKEGAGSTDALKILTHFYPKLQRKQLGIVRTFMAKIVPLIEHNGWVYYPAIVPFQFDIVD